MKKKMQIGNTEIVLKYEQKQSHEEILKELMELIWHTMETKKCSIEGVKKK